MSEQKVSGYKVWEPLLLAIVAVVCLIGGAKMTEKSRHAETSRTTAGAGQISEIVRFIEEQYVDEINGTELMEKAVESILKELDPHSGYISPSELEEINERMEGRFDGIGVQFHILRDSFVLLFVNPDGPADKAGLLAHDRIISADGFNLVGLDTDTPEGEKEVVRKLRGPKGSTVVVEVARDGVDSLLTFQIERDVIPIESVVTGYMLTENTGYIKVSHFSSTTYREFMTYLERLADVPEFDHLVIDLRQNPGGYLKEAINILSQLFQRKGQLLVYTEGEHSKRMDYKSSGKPYYKVDNIVVLIDGGSASASEIIAGAIQDHDRGVVVGSKSYGKGLVQEQYLLQNGGALRLTVARYYTPSGRSIQRPYVSEVSLPDKASGIPDSAIYRTDNGRIVLAEGGIDPDLEVPAKYDWYSGDAFVTYDQMLEFMFYGFEDPYTEEMAEWDDYLDYFADRDSLKADFAEFAGIDQKDSAALERDWDRVYTMLQAMGASYHFGYEAWYRVMNMDDPVVEKAIEVIEQDLRTTLKY